MILLSIVLIIAIALQSFVHVLVITVACRAMQNKRSKAELFFFWMVPRNCRFAFS